MHWTGRLFLTAALTASCLAGVPAVSAADAVPARTAEAVQQQSAQQLADAETMALLWMRTAAEYRALCYQGYNAAMMEIDRALAEPPADGKPLAIVLDCDETVVDNTPALARAAVNGNGCYTSLWWRDWIVNGEAYTMPGAADFLNEVHQKGVEIFYVTNRLESTSYDSSERNLRALGFPTVDREHLLLAVDTGNKQGRFDKVAETHHVILYMGDNAGDLPIGTYGKGRAERNAIIDANKDAFGTKYIVFPNPAYGAWVSALAQNYLGLTPEERDAANRALLLMQARP